MRAGLGTFGIDVFNFRHGECTSPDRIHSVEAQVIVALKQQCPDLLYNTCVTPADASPLLTIDDETKNRTRWWRDAGISEKTCRDL
jgi:hypothetical protein